MNMNKFVVFVGPGYLSHFIWEGDCSVPVLTNYAAAPRMGFACAHFIAMRLKEAGFPSIVEAVHG